MSCKLPAVAFVLAVSWAQAPAPEAPKAEAAKPLTSAEQAQVADKPPDQPQVPLLQNTGKPMLLPFQCTDEDMQWAGMSCTEEEPCPVYLELTAVAAINNRIIVAGNIHTESITLDSVLLASEDGGTTWREAFERQRGVGLDHVQFLDFQNGWISGQSLVPIMHDPFLLITSDGGKTWRQRAVFNEGGGGAIQQFWFESTSRGELVIDRMQSAESSRYELYESPNGGDTWMIRRTSSQPITLRRAGAPGSGWRLRADAKSKSYELEKRQDESWKPAASFLVRIGACQPAPRAAPAPEPAETPQPESSPPARPILPPSLKKPRPK